MKIKNKNLIISLLMSTIGTAFLIYYIFRASVDVVVSDYFRIINFYLEDVTDLHYLLSWEGISRIPFTFLARFINVKFFNYSVFFDKILGTFGLLLFNTIVLSTVLNNLKSKLMKCIATIFITYISFSLMAWEMILNGTGYAHFITIGLIALTFKIFSDNKRDNKRDGGHYCNIRDIVDVDTTNEFVGSDIICPKVGTKHYILLCVIIVVTSIIFAGSYTVSYNCTLILFMVIIFVYGIITNRIKEKYTMIETIDKPFFKEDFENARFYGRGKYRTFGVKRKRIIKYYSQFFYIIIPVICLLLYFKSNSVGDALVPVGFKEISLVDLLKTEPLFPIKFILKSLASSIIGVETLDYAINFKTITEKIIFFIGFLYLIVIIYAIIILVIKIWNKRDGGYYCYKRDIVDANNKRDGDNSLLIFISMFFVYGIANYLLVFLARYKFVDDSYGMSSRYSIQYMYLTIGIVMLLTKLIDDCLANIKDIDNNTISNKKFKKLFLIVASILSLSFIMLGHLTTNTDEIFKADYRKIIYSIVEEKAKKYKELKDDELENTFEYHRGPDQIRNAFAILEKQKLNIFREMK